MSFSFRARDRLIRRHSGLRDMPNLPAGHCLPLYVYARFEESKRRTKVKYAYLMKIPVPTILFKRRLL